MSNLIAGLTQKKGFDYRNHYLYADKVLVEMKTDGKIQKYDINLELLGFNLHYEAESPRRRMMLIAAIFGVPAFCGIVLLLTDTIGLAFFTGLYLLSALVAAAIYFYKAPQDDVFLVGGQKSLVFYRNIPTEENVSDFIEIVVKTTKEYYRNKFTQFDKTTRYEVFNWRMIWLRENGLIDEAQFNDVMEDFKISRLFN